MGQAAAGGKSGGGQEKERATKRDKKEGRRKTEKKSPFLEIKFSSLSLFLSSSFHGALPPAPPEAISGPLLAAAEVAPGAGERRLLRFVCEMISARSSCFLLLLKSFEVKVEVESFFSSLSPFCFLRLSPSSLAALAAPSLLELFG